MSHIMLVLQCILHIKDRFKILPQSRFSVLILWQSLHSAFGLASTLLASVSKTILDCLSFMINALRFLRMLALSCIPPPVS